MVTKIGILQFPGSNCDGDCEAALHLFDGVDPSFVWHQESDLSSYDGIVIPGGFSYGDYLRSGAMAANSPVMKSLKEFAKSKPVFGICNGFQILTESGLLPGALLRNANQKFMCKWVTLQSQKSSLPLQSLGLGDLSMPVANGEGRYYIDASGLANLKENGQIMFQYSEDVNGSVDNIAGVTNEKGNILGMMPHPERASVTNIHGGNDGYQLWQSFINMCR